jgi:DNA ligase 1
VEVPNRFTWVKSIDASSKDQDDLLTFFKAAVDTKCEGIMVKVLDELSQEEKVQAEKGKSDGKGSRRKALPATYGPSCFRSPFTCYYVLLLTYHCTLLTAVEPDKRTLGWCKVKKDYGSGRKAGWWSPILLALRNEEDGTLQAVCKCISGFTDQFYKDLNVTYSPEGENTTFDKPWDYESALTPDSMTPEPLNPRNPLRSPFALV